MKYIGLLITILVSLYSSACYTVVGISRSDDRIQNEATESEPDFAAYEPYGVTPSTMWEYYYETPFPWWYVPNADEYDAFDDTTTATDPTETSSYSSSRRNYGRRRAALNDASSGSSVSTGYASPVYSPGGTTPSFVPSYSTGSSASYSSPSTPVKTDSTVQSGSGSSDSNSNSTTKTQDTNRKRGYGNRRTAKSGDKK